ncbi:MAG: hypothetical protein IJ017_04450 [Oscillospiraceae bacterium]|nr:hypothetical protein [Oscillospiraceae bacterium]
MRERCSCDGCGYAAIEPAANRDGKRVFIRCRNPDLGVWTGRVMHWCKAEFADMEIKTLPRPAWCK